jgi:hypothetical protein
MLFGLVGLLLAGSVIPRSDVRSLVMAILTTLLPLAALYGLGSDPGRQRRASALALAFVTTMWASYAFETNAWRLAATGTAFLLMTYLAVSILDDVFRSGRVTVDTLYGALGAYFLIGLGFAAVYEAIEVLAPASFQGIVVDGGSLENSVYFSFVTLTTLGYGDITPVSSPARAVAILEAVTGIVFSTILLARLVALYSSPSRSQGGP